VVLGCLQLTPHTLVDMQGLEWSELKLPRQGLTIGATCVMNRLLQFSYPESWTAVKAPRVQSMSWHRLKNVATVVETLVWHCLLVPCSGDGSVGGKL